MKRLNSVITEQYRLEVVECKCGYHIGVDASYLLDVGDMFMICPNCSQEFRTGDVFPDEENPTYVVGG